MDVFSKSSKKTDYTKHGVSFLTGFLFFIILPIQLCKPQLSSLQVSHFLVFEIVLEVLEISLLLDLKIDI